MGVDTGNDVVRAAVVQMDVRIGEVDWNLSRVLERLEEAAAHGAKLIVFPECVLSGYCFSEWGEAQRSAVESSRTIGHDEIVAAGRSLGITAVVGVLAEEWDEGEGLFTLFNSAWIYAPGHKGDPIHTYSKCHLPVLGVDRLVSAGYGFVVVDAPIGNLGTLICYDIRFPEAARVLALQGADIIALPTNWPEGAESSPDFLTRARAWENRVYVLAANRVGVERGRRFIGRSQIVAPTGEILSEAGCEEETILYADLDLALARNKRIVIEPGEWEMDVIGGRRPELYGELTKTRNDK